MPYYSGNSLFMSSGEIVSFRTIALFVNSFILALTSRRSFSLTSEFRWNVVVFGCPFVLVCLSVPPSSRIQIVGIL